MYRPRYEIGAADYEEIEVELADIIDEKGNLEIIAYYKIVDDKIIYYDFQFPEDDLVGGKAHRMSTYELGAILQKQSEHLYFGNNDS